MTFYFKSYQQTDWQRRFSDCTSHYNPATQRGRVYKIDQWVSNHANYYKRLTQGLARIFILTQSREKLMALSLGCAIKQAPTFLEGKDEAFSPKESSLLRIFLFYFLNRKCEKVENIISWVSSNFCFSFIFNSGLVLF